MVLIFNDPNYHILETIQDGPTTQLKIEDGIRLKNGVFVESKEKNRKKSHEGKKQ